MIVQNKGDLARVPTGHAVLIAAGVGGRGRTQIIEAAAAKKLIVKNYRDTATWLSQQRAALVERKATRNAKKKPAEAKPAAPAATPAKAPVAPAQAKEAELTPEERKDREREQMEKVVTKRS